MSATTPYLSDDIAALGPFVDAGVLDASAVHVAEVIGRASGAMDLGVLLGAGLAARAVGFSHVCVVLAEVVGSIVIDDAQLPPVDTLPWPDPARWAAGLSASPAVRSSDDPTTDLTRPLVWDGTRLYLERYWRFEQRVAGDLLRRADTIGGLTTLSPELDAILDEFFGPNDPSSPDRQREAAGIALSRRLAVIAGGPGTGKTRTIARLLAAAHRVAIARDESFDVALAAPTGKAAARMTEAVHREVEVVDISDDIAGSLRAAEAMTLHRLLGASRMGGFLHDRLNPLPHDMVIVDETSMVSLPLMARLLDAVRPDATLVLVGDPFQLASVEAGAVLGEIVGTAEMRSAGGRLAPDVVLLDRVHRFSVDSPIAALADAIRTGDANRAIDLLRSNGTGELSWVDGDDEAGVDRLQQEVAERAVDVVRAARSGDAQSGLDLASDLKVLCATRLGPLGVYRWSDRIEALATREMPDAGFGRRWYVGKPVIVTRNDYLNRTFNGDVGLVVAGKDRPVVAFPDPNGIRELAMSQLGDVETWWAMTIHKSQGSEFRRVIVTLPGPPSPILTRELLYTAVTRAKEQVTVVATVSSLRTAITRPVSRASGLGPLLWH
ncbi:MAG: exodeoxyribonuclease V subunit alpha [Acidimicrobiales bacterium]